MNHSKKISICVLVLSCVFSSAIAANDDWPQWMGAEMKGVWNETGLVGKFPDGGPKVLWRKPIGPGYSGPSVSGGLIFVMERTKPEVAPEKKSDEPQDPKKPRIPEIAGGERVLCLNQKTGEEVWSHTYDCPYRISYPSGPRCTPTVDGDRVYTLGAMGDLICFNKSDGKIIWQKKLTEEYETKPPFWGYASHPFVDGDRLVLPVGGKGSALVAFDKQTGTEIWKALTTEDVAYVPLVFFEDQGKRQLIFWHGDGVDSVDPESGKHHWHHKWPEEKVQAQATTIITPPVLGNQIYFSEFYKGSLMLELSSDPPGVEEIRRSFKDDPRHKKSINSLMTTPIVKDGHIFGITGMGEMRCVEWETGELKWNNSDWMSDKLVTFATAFIVQNQDRYFMFLDNGELMIANFSVEGFEEIDRAKILEPDHNARGRKVVWSHPAFSNGTMIARNDGEIVCVSLKKE